MPVDRYLQSVFARFQRLLDGEVADYIAPLAAVDPDRFAICIATVDGQIYEVGDSSLPFTIQSVSKPFTYGLALEHRGLRSVLERIGVEPSGDAFNEISLDAQGRPFNPMINAGAIMASSMIDGDDPFGQLLERYSTWAGRPLEIDQGVYEAERDTGHRNRAISHMLRAVGTLESDPERALEVYFKQCSVNVTNRDLAVMAATLAARGVNPLTGRRALSDDLVDHVLSVMTTCGMYDAAGEWLVDVGIPAKSGVGGGIIGVLPGQLGVAVFSPRLDAVGNSVRGLAVYRQLAADLRLHFLNVGRSNRATVATSYLLCDVPSTRARTPADRSTLDSDPDAVIILELTGDLLFSGAESITRTVLGDERDFVILDLHRVGIVDAAASRVLAELARELRRQGAELVLTAAHDITARTVGARSFDDVDAAKEWCEDKLLGRLGKVSTPTTDDELPLGEHPFFAEISPDDIARVCELGEWQDVEQGAAIIVAGSEATHVFVLTHGEVEVSILTGHGDRRRLVTLAAGAIFGESAMTTGGLRTADVVALSAARFLAIEAKTLRGADVDLRVQLLEALLTSSHHAVARSTRTIAALSR